MLHAGGTPSLRNFKLPVTEQSSHTFAVCRRRDFCPKLRPVLEQLWRWLRMQSISLTPWDSTASLSWDTTGARVPPTRWQPCSRNGYQHWRLYRLAISRAASSRFPVSNSRRDFGISGYCVSAAGQKLSGKILSGFARMQWDTWSPPGWFDDDEFTATAEGFSHPDWVEITLNAYRARWVQGEQVDSHYDSLQQRLGEVERLSTPALMIQGGSDYCDDPKESEGLEKFFSVRYDRLLLEGIGHFPHRERPMEVAEAVLCLLRDAR
jgi:pimeloyl-ACP methyl ester carboxylesterase